MGCVESRQPRSMYGPYGQKMEGGENGLKYDMSRPLLEAGSDSDDDGDFHQYFTPLPSDLSEQGRRKILNIDKNYESETYDTFGYFSVELERFQFPPLPRPKTSNVPCDAPTHAPAKSKVRPQHLIMPSPSTDLQPSGVDGIATGGSPMTALVGLNNNNSNRRFAPIISNTDMPIGVPSSVPTDVPTSVRTGHGPQKASLTNKGISSSSRRCSDDSTYIAGTTNNNASSRNNTSDSGLSLYLDNIDIEKKKLVEF